ncbi:MAG: hypothetical protein IJ027_00855 [Oscillospiraceae bacterium]|nr:hypothetical protein [Oscillospiraceae bacterium]
MDIMIPNLPQNKVTLFAVAEGFDTLSDALKAFGAEVITVKRDSTFESCESNHPDMHIHHLGGKKVLLYREDEYLCKELVKRGFEVVFAAEKKQGKYPKSAALNACRIGNILLCNEKALEPNLRLYAEQNGVEIVPCRQGYARCSTCVVSENAVITSDASVAKALKGRVDLLEISKGQIKLGGSYDGFIGGCSSMIDKNALAFFGDITRHSDYINIKSFLENHSVLPVVLCGGELIDVGTFIPLKTK